MMIEEMQMTEERMYNDKGIKKSTKDKQMNGDCVKPKIYDCRPQTSTRKSSKREN